MYKSSFCGHPGRICWALGITTLLACVVPGVVLHEPVPRTHDEFSYILLGDTLSAGRFSNPAPSSPEFFDSFHIIVHPVYASKYFPAQGAILALGEKVTAHRAFGIWLSSALACASMYWMILSFVPPQWAALGASLMALQYGIFSYWSQSYWGGMVAALGGALAFGAIRRLWYEFSWESSFWLALGIVVLVNSRPLEGTIALLPVTSLFLLSLFRESRWNHPRFGLRFVLPLGIVLVCGVFLTCTYNRAITGSPWKAPYMLHEEQYQETPEFGFLPVRPKLTYSNPWLQYWFEVREFSTYRALRNPKLLPGAIGQKMVTWWEFFCGLALTPALVTPGLLRKGWIRWGQAALLVLLPLTWTASDLHSTLMRGIFDFLAFVQIALLWVVFESFWPRMAILTCALLIFESFFVKLFFPHYFAPAASLVLYLQVEGLRRVWNWTPATKTPFHQLTRAERRRLARAKDSYAEAKPPLRGIVCVVVVVCFLALCYRLEARIQGWKLDQNGPVRGSLLIDDWSLRRADLDAWLEKQPGPQLVFVWYSARHDVTEEWVYNHADLLNSHVIWAHNWGLEHNRLLLRQLPGRTVWFLDADQRDPHLIPYSEVESHAGPPPTILTGNGPERDAEQ